MDDIEDAIRHLKIAYGRLESCECEDSDFEDQIIAIMDTLKDEVQVPLEAMMKVR